MKFDKKYVTGRYAVVIALALLLGIAIIARAMYTMTVDRVHWMKMTGLFVVDSVVIKPNRGNILSSDGVLMASSLPDFKVYIDFRSGGADSISEVYAQKDTLLHDNLDSMCVGLSQIVKGKTPEEFKEHLEKGWTKGARYYDVTPGKHLTYIQYKDLEKLPYFNISNKNLTGVIYRPRNNRKKPFGSLAKRTLGEMYGEKDSAQYGIEAAFDSLLRGEPGKGHKKKIRDTYTEIIDREPKHGYDLLTTLDVGMQDICESALKEKLIELDAEFGTAVLMEVKTGDVKGIANLTKVADGVYQENKNHALTALMEPGSTFKTASFLVALDDGVVSMDDKVNVGNGVLPMYGSKMRDHNWTRGGYGRELDVTEIMMFSSNVGTAKLIDDNYKANPQKFVDGLKRVGIGTSLGLPFSGVPDPQVRDTSSRYWSKTSLPWMSIGYENQIPPISTLAFYNAIANDGKMVKPRFVKGLMRDGEMIEEFPVVTLIDKICGDKALKEMQGILEAVVSRGTAKQVRNEYFSVSGKTGTAQVAEGGGGYKSGTLKYLASFCGYFPSDNPQYSCIVVIKKKHSASGGSDAGPVFSKIARRVYSKNFTSDIAKAKDLEGSMTPEVKNGDYAAATSVLKDLGIMSSSSDAGSKWQRAENADGSVAFTSLDVDDNQVPDLTGMGARDAIYALENVGLKAKIMGCGKVKRQSVAPGGKFVQGQTVVLELN